ncbi:helix-turn-helix domain-containing protein [Paenibacillus koleovorans]|uniref:helix-turn-helix domain-containing protein n=1 Tax=Paenibacillus koleovorans TaxID=121608 RepID=UPI0013E3BB7E|nr:AraC family transcriptional regulator [Paenibacillus koleovorans]
MAHIVEMYPKLVPYIRRAGHIVRKKPFRPGDRRLLDYQLIYIQEGSCTFHVDGDQVEVGKGKLVLIQPGQVHAQTSTGELFCSFLILDLFYQADRETRMIVQHGMAELGEYEDQMQPRLNDFEGIHVPPVIRIAQEVRFKETMLKAIGLWQSHIPFNKLEAGSLASELILSILREYVEWNPAQPQGIASLEWIPAYMTQHLNEPLSIDGMASRAGMTSSRFYEMFKKKYGVSPYQYLLHMRIQQAQLLLKSTSMNLEEIADCCGFADMYHLSKMFKKITGLSPREFRRL